MNKPATAAGAGSAQPRAEQVLYEYQPRHENGMLLDWTKLDVDTDEEARDYCAPRGFEWRRTIAGQSAQPRAEGDERTLKMRFVSTITAATSLGEQRVYDLAGSLIEVVRAALGQNAQAATAAGAGSAQLARQQQAAPHAPSVPVQLLREALDATKSGMGSYHQNYRGAELGSAIEKLIDAAPAAPHAQAEPVGEVELKQWGKEEWEVHWVGEISKFSSGLYYLNYKVGDKVKLYAAPVPQEAEQSAPAAVTLTVWYGAIPESNGKSNFTAVLMRKDSMWSGPHVTIQRGEYPDRIRYEADRVRHLIGELAEEPSILDYDADKHSGYTQPAAPAVTDAARDVLADAKDAARYRWLRNEAWGGNMMRYKFPHVVEYGPGLMRSALTELAEEALDAAIDAAMRANDGAAEGGKA